MSEDSGADLTELRPLLQRYPSIRICFENRVEAGPALFLELFERASFWYWDRKKKQYWTIVALGRDRIVIEEGAELVGSSIQNNEVLIINDPYADERFCVHVGIESGFVSRSIL